MIVGIVIGVLGTFTGLFIYAVCRSGRKCGDEDLENRKDVDE